MEAAVYGVPDPVMGEKVAAAVVAVPGTEPTVEEIREFCADKLAKYKIPEYIQFTPFLPKNAGGQGDQGTTAEGVLTDRNQGGDHDLIIESPVSRSERWGFLCFDYI